jgi:hypothetical protein
MRLGSPRVFEKRSHPKGPAPEELHRLDPRGLDRHWFGRQSVSPPPLDYPCRSYGAR